MRKLEITVITKNTFIPIKSFSRPFRIDLFEGLCHFARKRGNDTNEIFGVSSDKFLVQTGTVVKPFEVRGSDELNEVLVPRKSFSEQHQSGTRFIYVCFFIKTCSRCEIRIKANNGFDFFFGTRFIEINSAVEGAAIGDCEGFLPVFFGSVHEFFGGRDSAEEGIVRVGVEVNKSGINFS